VEVQEDLGRKWPNIPHVHQPGRGQAEGEESSDKVPEPARVARGGAPADAGQPGGGGGVEAAPAAARQLAVQAGQQDPAAEPRRGPLHLGAERAAAAAGQAGPAPSRAAQHPQDQESARHRDRDDGEVP